MSTQADTLLHQIQSLPAQDVEALFWQFTAWLRKAEGALVNEDPIRSARGMFTGARLNKALLAARAEDRYRE